MNGRPIPRFAGRLPGERKGTGQERPNRRITRLRAELDKAEKADGPMESREWAAMEAFRRGRKAKPPESDLEWRDRTWMP